MPDVLKRVMGPAALAAAAATVYTAPALTTTTIRAIHVANETLLNATFTLSVGADAAGKRFFYQQQVAPGNSFDWTGSLILAAAEVVQAYASIAATLTLTMSGVEST
jgi:hypothetical protein